MIKIEHLQKYFNRGKRSEIHVLNDITLELPQTGFVAGHRQYGRGQQVPRRVRGTAHGGTASYAVVSCTEGNTGKILRGKW